MSSVLRTVLNYQEQNTDFIALEQASIERDMEELSKQNTTLESLYALADSIQSLSASNEDFSKLTSKVSLEGVMDSIVEHAKKLGTKIKEIFKRIVKWFKSVLNKFIDLFRKKKEESKKSQETSTPNTHETAAMQHQENVHSVNHTNHEPHEQKSPMHQKPPVFVWTNANISRLPVVLFVLGKGLHTLPNEFTEHDVRNFHSDALKQMHETNEYLKENMEKLKSVAQKTRQTTIEKIATGEAAVEFFNAVGAVFKKQDPTTADVCLKSIFGDFIIEVTNKRGKTHELAGEIYEYGYFLNYHEPEKFIEFHDAKNKARHLVPELNERNSTMPKIQETSFGQITDLLRSMRDMFNEDRIYEDLFIYDIDKITRDNRDEYSGESKKYFSRFLVMDRDLNNHVLSYFGEMFNYFSTMLWVIEQTTL